MNNSFSTHRFWNYFLFDLKTLRGNIGMMVLLMGLAPIIFYVFYMLFGNLFDGDFFSKLLTEQRMKGPSLGARIGVFVAVTFIFSILFPSRAYGFITEKKAGSSWLLLPASRSEKFISMLLCTLVAVPAVFFLLYFCSDWFVCFFYRTCGYPLLTMNLNGENGLFSFIGDGPVLVANGFWILYVFVAQNIAAFLLGGLLFRKWKVVGTIAALFGLNTLATVFMSMLIGNVDFEHLGEKIAQWVCTHADSINFWLNGLINLKVGLILAACGVGIWFRLKSIKH